MKASHLNLLLRINQLLYNSFLHIKVNIKATKNQRMLTIRRGETSPTAALPAIVLNAQNIEVKVSKKWALEKNFISTFKIKKKN
jgi:hypothetical protein